MSTALIALLRNPVTLAEYELDRVAFVQKYTYCTPIDGVISNHPVN